MGDVVINKTAGDEGNSITVADIGEELVAQAFTLGCAAHQTGHVHKGDAGRNDFLGTGDFSQFVQARFRHSDVAGVRLDGAERIVCSLRRCRLGQGVEQGGLADIGQTDNRDFKSHGIPRERVPLAVPSRFVSLAQLWPSL